MPPRSFYNSPRNSDYHALISANYPEDVARCTAFLNEHNVPFLESIEHLACYLGLAPALIRQILHKPGYHYRRFSIPKGNGEQREIFTPRSYLKVIQWWILDNILSRTTCSDIVHGFRPGRSYITNATVHFGSTHIFNADIEAFFPSIDVNMISNVFRGFGYQDDAVIMLTGLVSYRNSAPTGAPTSPMLGNIILEPLDNELRRISNPRNICYTRYADDLTFSSREFIESAFQAQVQECVDKYGFRLNPMKNRFMGPGDRMEVTGVVINEKIQMPKKWRNKVRGIMHRAKNNPQDYLDRFHYISGHYGTLKSIDPNHDSNLTRAARATMEALEEARAELHAAGENIA